MPEPPREPRDTPEPAGIVRRCCELARRREPRHCGRRAVRATRRPGRGTALRRRAGARGVGRRRPGRILRPGRRPGRAAVAWSRMFWVACPASRSTKAAPSAPYSASVPRWHTDDDDHERRHADDILAERQRVEGGECRAVRSSLQPVILREVVHHAGGSDGVQLERVGRAGRWGGPMSRSAVTPCPAQRSWPTTSIGELGGRERAGASAVRRVRPRPTSRRHDPLRGGRRSPRTGAADR